MLKLILRAFNPPKIDTENVETLTKYLFAYRIFLFGLIAVSLNLLSLIINWDLISFIVLLITFLIIFSIIIYIRKTSNYFTPSLFLIIFAVIATQYSFFLLPKESPVAVYSWIVIEVMFAFFVFGSLIGFIFFSVNFSCVLYFFMYYFEANQHILTHDEATQNTVLVSVGFIAIGFLGWQNFMTGELAKKIILDAKSEMQDQYNVISKQNEEKTVMLKEIHHRVKNNLQIITSLLRLQSRELESPEAIAKFKDAIHRVIAMSMIHEKMYQNDALSSMHLREYLHDLTNDLISSYQSDYEVKLHIDCDVETIGLRSVVPLALILNELISNTLKYAFDDEKNCWISISFNYLSGNNCKLIYKDGGTWKPPSRKGSFGLDLIESLTYQLDGTMRMETQPETIFEFILTPQIDDDSSRFDSENV